MLPVWVRTLRFTVLVPGTVTVVVPALIVALTQGGRATLPTG